MQDTSSPIEELIEEFHAIVEFYEQKQFRPRQDAQQAIDLYRERLARLEKELREDNADWDSLIPRYFETGLTLSRNLTGRPKDRIRLDTFGEGSYEPVFDLTIVNNSTLSASDKFPALQARADRINDCWHRCLNLQYERRNMHSQTSGQHSKLKWNGLPSELAESFGFLYQNGWFQADSAEDFFRQVADIFSIVAIDGKEEPANAASLRKMFDRATTPGARQKDSRFECLKAVKNPRKPT